MRARHWPRYWLWRLRGRPGDFFADCTFKGAGNDSVYRA